MESEIELNVSMSVKDDKVQKQAQNAGKRAGKAYQDAFKEGADKVGEKMQEGVKDAENGVNKVSAKTKQMFNAIKKGFSVSGGNSKFFDLLTNKITLAIAAVGLLGKWLFSMWEKAGASVSGYLKKQEAVYSDAQEKTQKEEKRQETDNNYFNELKELAKAESLSNAEKKHAIEIIEELTQRYGDLGLSIDTATGSITGLDRALSKMNKKQIDTRILNAKDEYSALEAQRDIKEQSAFVKLSQNNAITESIYSAIHKMTGRMPRQAAEAQQMISGMDDKERLQFFTQLRGKASTESEVQSIQEVIDLLKKQVELREKINALQKMRASFDDRQIEAEKAKSREIVRQEQQKQDDLDRQRREAVKAHQYGNLKTDAERINFQQGELQLKQTAIANMRAVNQQIQGKRYGDELERSLDKAKILDIEAKLKTDLPPEERAKLEAMKKALEVKVYPHDAERAKDMAQIEKNETRIKQLMNQELEIQQRIQDLRKRTNDYVEEETAQSRDYVYQKQQYMRGNYAEVQRSKLEAELRRSGLNPTAQQKQDLLQGRQAKRSADVDAQLAQQGLQLVRNATPHTLQNAIQQRIKDLERQNGVSLTQDQRKKVQQIVKIEFQKSDFERLKADLSRANIQTNELTARGGFASGAYVPKTEDYVKSVLQVQRQALSNLSNIYNTLQKGGII